MFEVQDLRYATLATVSRCGMVWFSEDILSTEMIFSNYLSELKAKAIEEIEEDIGLRRQVKKGEENVLSPTMQVIKNYLGSHVCTVHTRERRFVKRTSMTSFRAKTFREILLAYTVL